MSRVNPALHFYGGLVRRRALGAGLACLAIPMLSAVAHAQGAGEAGRDPAPAGKAKAASFRDARSAWLKGKYADAIAMCDMLATKKGGAIRAACLRARIDLNVGDYREGQARLLAVKEGDGHADWHVAAAALAHELGEYEKAIDHANKALKEAEDHLGASWQLGRALERLGRDKEAIAAYRMFDDVMTGPDLMDDPQDVTLLGLGFYRYSVRTQSGKTLVDRTRHILTEVYQEVSDFLDADYWPARQAAGELLLSKHNLPDARLEFEAVLEVNPKAADAHVGLGRSYLEDWGFEQVEKHGEAALAVNPRHVGALVLMADCRMTERRYAEAASYAERALAVNPRAEEALGVLAGAKIFLGDARVADELQARAEKVSATPAQFHYAVGTWLSAGRQFNDAEARFKKAIELAPWWPEPRTSLGQLYMETGEEHAARTALESSFKLDSFDHHTFNVLDLLDSLAKFRHLESENFVVKYDPVEDAVAAPYFSRTLESLHDDLCTRYGAKLDKRTIVELFPNHSGFSVRVTGRPFIATVGACTGRVIAMTAPRGEPPFGRFNWASVLRHEFTHTVTLAATGNRIPHWMTEGLAVWEEKPPRSWAWKQMLSDALRTGELFTLASIDWGFMRPRRPNDRTLAYAQSEWMIEFIIEKHGFDAVLAMLEGFRKGRTLVENFRSGLGTEIDAFDAQFREWARVQVDAWGLPTTPVEEPDKLREQLPDREDDAGLWARLARAELLRGRFDEAESAAKKALARDAREPVALEVQARLCVGRMLAEEDEADRRAWIDKAEPYIRTLLEIDASHPEATKYLGYLEQTYEQWTEALALYRKYQERFPEDPDPYRRSAGIYLRLRKTDAALEQLEKLFALVEDEPAVARQVADIYAQRGQPARAAEWYRKAIEIDPYEANTHGALADALFDSGEYQAAAGEFEVVTKLMPREAIGYDGLSRCHERLGNRELAETYKKKAETFQKPVETEKKSEMD